MNRKVTVVGGAGAWLLPLAGFVGAALTLKRLRALES